MAQRHSKRPALSLDSKIVQDNTPLEIVPKLFIGSIHASFNLEALNDLGITHILNCSRLPPTFPKNFTYLCVDVKDRDESNILACISAANIFIEAGIDAGGILVHCVGGRSRSAAFITGFIMSSLGWSYEQTVLALKSVRPVVSINKGFEIQLRAYAATQFDIYAAQQVLVRCRIQALYKYRSQLGGLAVSSPTPRSRVRTYSNEDNNSSNNGLGTNKYMYLSSNAISKPISRASSLTSPTGPMPTISADSQSSTAGSKRSFESKDEYVEDEDSERGGSKETQPSDGSMMISSRISFNNGSSNLNSLFAGQAATTKQPATFQSKLREWIPYFDHKTPNIRLSRPGSHSTIRIIPPLRGMEKGFCCSWCGAGLFSIANVVRGDIDTGVYLPEVSPYMQAEAKSSISNAFVNTTTGTSLVPQSQRRSLLFQENNVDDLETTSTPRSSVILGSQTDMGPPTPRSISSPKSSGPAFTFTSMQSNNSNSLSNGFGNNGSHFPDSGFYHHHSGSGGSVMPRSFVFPGAGEREVPMPMTTRNRGASKPATFDFEVSDTMMAADDKESKGIGIGIGNGNSGGSSSSRGDKMAYFEGKSSSLRSDNNSMNIGNTNIDNNNSNAVLSTSADTNDWRLSDDMYARFNDSDDTPASHSSATSGSSRLQAALHLPIGSANSISTTINSNHHNSNSSSNSNSNNNNSISTMSSSALPSSSSTSFPLPSGGALSATLGYQTTRMAQPYNFNAISNNIMNSVANYDASNVSMTLTSTNTLSSTSSATSSTSSIPQYSIDESPRIPIPPHRLHDSWSPRDRPHSVEKKRWLARVNLLQEGMKNERLEKLAEDDEEALRLAFGREKYIYVEYLEWMGQEVFRPEADVGEICCYQCKKVIGSYTWQPSTRQSLEGKLCPPLFRIHKNVVQQSDLPLDATPSNTPRLDDDVSMVPS